MHRSCAATNRDNWRGTALLHGRCFPGWVSWHCCVRCVPATDCIAALKLWNKVWQLCKPNKVKVQTNSQRDAEKDTQRNGIAESNTSLQLQMWSRVVTMRGVHYPSRWCYDFTGVSGCPAILPAQALLSIGQTSLSRVPTLSSPSRRWLRLSDGEVLVLPVCLGYEGK